MASVWKFIKTNKVNLVIGVVIIVIAIIFRVSNLAELPVFADEAIYIRWAQIMRNEPSLRFLPLTDGKQPLYMWSIIPFFKVIANPLVAGRMVSVVTGIGTLAGIFVLTKILFSSTRTALIASFIYAVSPYSVFFDRIALADSMLAMFSIWTVIFAYLSAQKIRFDYAMLAGFTLGFAFLTKSPAVFVAIMLPLTWLMVKWPKSIKKRSILVLKLGLLIFTTFGISFGMYNILRLGPNFHLIAQRNQDYVLPLSHLWTNPKDPFIFYIDRVLEWFWQLGPSLLVVFAVGGVIMGIIKKSKAVLIMGLLTLFPILVQAMYAKAFTTRYVLFSLPFAIILASFVFVGKQKKFNSSVILNGGLLVFALHAFWINYLIITKVEAAPLPRVMRSGYLEEWTSGTGIKQASELIRKKHLANPDDNIVVGTEGYFGTLPDGLQMYLSDLPEITVIGIGLGINKLPIQLEESKDFGNKTYLVVNSSRLLEKPGNMGLSLVAAFPKAFRPKEQYKEYIHFGPRDTLYLFEVN